MAESRAGYWGLTLALGLMPLIATFAPLGMVPLVMAAALLSLVLGWRFRPWTLFPHRFALLLLTVTLWAGATALWAIEPERALRTSGQWLGVSFAGLVLIATAGKITAAQARWLTLLLLGGLALTGLFVIEERLSCGWVATHVLRMENFCPGGFFIYKRPLTVAALMTWPGVWLAWRGWPDFWMRFAGLGVMALVAMAALGMGAGAAMVSVALGAGIIGAVLLLDRKAVRALAVLFAVVIAVLPVAASQIPDARTVWLEFPHMPGSAHHRLTIWRFVAEKWAEHPLRGWGMEASRVIPGAEDIVRTQINYPGTETEMILSVEQKLPLHPHNMALQWWLELGAPGAALLAGLVVMVFGFACRLGTSRLDRGFATAAASAAVVISMVSFGAWQHWWLCSLWLAGALCVAATRTEAA